MIISRDVYGLKSNRSAWHEKLAKTLNSMGYHSTVSEPYLCFKRAVKPSSEEY